MSKTSASYAKTVLDTGDCLSRVHEFADHLFDLQQLRLVGMIPKGMTRQHGVILLHTAGMIGMHLMHGLTGQNVAVVEAIVGAIDEASNVHVVAATAYSQKMAFHGMS